ncbi:MAG: SLC13 family permease [Candidatus Hydrothermarchaeaceae archaeon]
MSGDHGEGIEATGILANKNLLLGIGFGLFILIGFLLPAPGGMFKIMDENGYARDMFSRTVVGSASDIERGIESGEILIADDVLSEKVHRSIKKGVFHKDYKKFVKEQAFQDAVFSNPVMKEKLVKQAAGKAKLVVALTIMVVVFFATDAMPVGAAALLIPLVGYFFTLDGPGVNVIAKNFFNDAAIFIIGVLALGYAVAEVGLHSRIAVLILGRFRGFRGPIFAITIILALLGSFISAHALAAFLAPVMASIYYGSVLDARRKGLLKEGEHDRELAKMLLLALTYGMNVGGVGSPIAGGRNVIIMNYFDELYNVPMSFIQWCLYGLPMVPILGLVVGVYMLLRFKPKVRDLTPGIQSIKDELKKKGPMDYGEKVMAFVLALLLFFWIVPEFLEGFGIELPIGNLGLGGPALLALVLPPLFRVVDWEKMLKGIAWDAWFVYIGAMGLGAFMQSTGAALWIATSFMGILPDLATAGLGLWVSVSFLSGFITNFMSDAATTALLGPITTNMGMLSGHHYEPWASGLATAFATSFAHFLIIGTPNNVIVYGLARYPDTGERILHPTDFIKYGVIIWALSLLVMWIFTFVVVYNVVGFPDGMFETAKEAMGAAGGAASVPATAVEAAH